MRVQNVKAGPGEIYQKLILFGIVMLLFAGCKQGDTGNGSYSVVLVRGQTMGTTYNIKFEDQPGYLNYQFEIDSVLIDVNDAVSHYIPTSVISRFNAADSVFTLPKAGGDKRQNLLTRYFMANYRKSVDIWKLTNGAFDPTVGPLVNFWGFGTEGKKEVGNVDSSVVEEIRQLVGLDRITLSETMAAYRFEKEVPGMQLDFSAIAKGFGIDEVCALLEKKGVQNYMVEIGGEVGCKGVNPDGNDWKLGISQPTEKALPGLFYATIEVSAGAMASSGNYRNYYIIDGIRRFHSINPQSGFPEENRLRSATILTPDCMTADALATACMVMGVEKAKSLVYTIDGIDAFFIYENERNELEHFATPGVVYTLIQ